MDLSILFKGVGIGFSIAAPVGPIGLLCIQRTLQHGRTAGLISGLGAATADACYGLIAGAGITSIATILVQQSLWLRWFGLLVLGYLGFKILLSKPAAQAAQNAANTLVGIYTSTFLLTITNPMTILSFMGIIAGLGIASANKTWLPILFFVGGVFLGSALWWLLLSSLVHILREKLSPQRFIWVNRISGGIILTYTLIILISLIIPT